jgi:hypothetical protein
MSHNFSFLARYTGKKVPASEGVALSTPSTTWVIYPKPALNFLLFRLRVRCAPLKRRGHRYTAAVANRQKRV